MEGTHTSALRAAAATLLIALCATLALAQAPEDLLAQRVTLERNTYACGGSVRCEAYVLLPSAAARDLASGDLVVSLAYLNGTESGIPVRYRIGHREAKAKAAEQACVPAVAKNGTRPQPCPSPQAAPSKEDLVWHGERLVKGENVVHLWTDEKPAGAVVDWNFRIEDVPVQDGAKAASVAFDTRAKGWAIWGTAQSGWQDAAFTKRRNLTISDAGRTNTPVRVAISGLGAAPGSGFAIYGAANASKPISYLDANEHLTSSAASAAYLLFTADSGETYFIYSNNASPVAHVPAFLAWDRFVNSSNNLPWTVQGGTWTFSNGYASKSASGCFGSVCGVRTQVPGLSSLTDVGAFARVRYDSRGDSMRFGFSCGNVWNAQGIFDDFGPDSFRTIGAGTSASYSGFIGAGGSTNAWHDYTIRYGTAAHALYEDENALALVTWATPAAGQAFNPAYNATCMGGQEQGDGRFDDYALWDWTLLGRVRFYDGLTTSYALGAVQQTPAAANESEARAAMLSGIEGSAIAGNATLHWDRQVVVRLANGTQYSATHDLLVASGTKRWALSYEQDPGVVFAPSANLTQVLWVWQRANLTAQAIAADVGALINSTH